MGQEPFSNHRIAPSQIHHDQPIQQRRKDFVMYKKCSSYGSNPLSIPHNARTPIGTVRKPTH